MWSKVLEWRGVLAITVFALVSLWLAFDGRLGFYIHPRYNLFTTAMAVIALVLLLIAVFTHKKTEHTHDHEPSRARRRRFRLVEVLSLATTLAVVVAVLVLPPATLSSATAENRSANELDVLASSPVEEGMGNEVFATLTVRDWASLIVQNQSPAFYRGKPLNAVGIVTESPDNEDVFLLTRFVVTCCAVDAQPVSIPVYLPDWRSTLRPDSWVRVQGGFQPAPAGISGSPVVVVPVVVEDEEVPREPYLF